MIFLTRSNVNWKGGIPLCFCNTRRIFHPREAVLCIMMSLVVRISVAIRLFDYDELIHKPAKAFKYLTPLLKILPSHLDHTPLLRSRSFHVLADPPELVSTVSELLLYRSRGGIAQRPLIVSEPLPSSCIPENYHAFLEAINHVDIFSPNHVEIAQLFGNEHPEVFNKPALENYATIFLTSGIGPSRCGAIVIRAAEYGCLITSTHQLPTWLPPYYANPLQAEADKSKVVDPTGAGNTFLGAFTLSYLKTHNLIEAAIYGTVGASFALEQIGIPVFEVDERGWETWNGEKVKGRVGGYRERVAVKKLLG